MLHIENLCKTYPTFALKNVSFDVPKGYITGFIGRNGAGKTTTLKCVMNAVCPDSGTITAFGKDSRAYEEEMKQNVGFVLGGADYYKMDKIKTITAVYRRFYRNWREERYRALLSQFGLDENKPIGQLSSGMKVKYALALALSHEPELLLLDEPTSGLDPVSRDELLDLFQAFVEDGEHSILFSTHITSDLEKVADNIVLLRDGEVALQGGKDDILSSHVLLSGRREDAERLSAQAVPCKTNKFGVTALFKAADAPEGDFERRTPDLEEIMIYYNKEKEK